MSATPEPSPAAASAVKPLWIAIGVLGAAVVAMGTTLVIQSQQPAPVASPAPAAPGVAKVEPVPAVPAPVASAASSMATAENPASKAVAKPVPVTPRTVQAPRPVPVMPTPQPQVQVATVPQSQRVAGAASAPVIYSGYPPAPSSGGAPVPVPQPMAQVPAKPLCGNCATVDGVTPVQRKGQAGVTGALAGGVLGALVGNQIGHGSGKAAATAAGAVGGALAGNVIEKNMKKETVFQVRLRMDDGTTRTVEQATAPAVGARVVVEGNTLRSADTGMAAPQPAPRVVQPGG